MIFPLEFKACLVINMLDYWFYAVHINRLLWICETFTMEKINKRRFLLAVRP